MAELTTIAQSGRSQPANALLLDFSWKSSKVTIVEEDASKALYTMSMKTFRSPCLTFKRADDTTFGTGNVHLISINADCTLEGKTIKLEALKRLKTSYTHQSRTLRCPDGSPQQLTWTTHTDYLKTWSFICLNEQSMPVAKLTYNFWAVQKNIGRIEFDFDQPVSEELRCEIVVTSLTLLYCMMVRMNNIFALVGSAMHRKPSIAQSESK